MKQETVLNKIQSNNLLSEDSLKVFFSGRHMAMTGFLVLLTPVLGYFTKWLTFGYDFGIYRTIYISISNPLFFWGMSTILSRMIPLSECCKNQLTHTLVRKTLSITRTILHTIFGLILVMSIIGKTQYTYPIIMILLGIQLSISSTFSISVIKYVAQSYIFCGLIQLYLSKYQIPYITFYFLFYYGLSQLIIGFLLIRDENKYLGLLK